MVDHCAPSALSVQSGPYTCGLCSTPARYKCPRCATPTCSLPCSREHKQDTGCTGERDKVQHVPMNAYGWGTMMRDYCYLEDVGRKVADWGSEIACGGYMDNHGANRVTSAPKSSSRRKPVSGKSKRDVLRDHLDTLGIDVEMLPAGMERRNLNQSTFDQKLKCPLLTVESVFHPPTTLASISSSPAPSHKILSHRNSLSVALLTVLQRQVALTLSSKLQKHKENTPDWLPSMVTPHPEAPECFVPPHCYIRANSDLPRISNTAYYHKLEPTSCLSELLRGTSFVEFPTIHVFDSDASSFNGTLIDKSGLIVRILEDEQVNISKATKRRRLDETVGLETVFSMVGGYGSEGSSLSDEETGNKNVTGLATLETYSASDDEVVSQNAQVEEDRSANSDDDALAEGDQLGLDPTRLLELVKQVRTTADEDMLDWGDEWDVDATDVEPF